MTTSEEPILKERKLAKYKFKVEWEFDFFDDIVGRKAAEAYLAVLGREGLPIPADAKLTKHGSSENVLKRGKENSGIRS